MERLLEVTRIQASCARKPGANLRVAVPRWTVPPRAAETRTAPAGGENAGFCVEAVVMPWTVVVLVRVVRSRTSEPRVGALAELRSSAGGPRLARTVRSPVTRASRDSRARTSLVARLRAKDGPVALPDPPPAEATEDAAAVAGTSRGPTTRIPRPSGNVAETAAVATATATDCTRMPPVDGTAGPELDAGPGRGDRVDDGSPVRDRRGGGQQRGRGQGRGVAAHPRAAGGGEPCRAGDVESAGRGGRTGAGRRRQRPEVQPRGRPRPGGRRRRGPR